MTLQSERIRQAHRGASLAEPASRSRLAALDSFGLRYERIDDFNVMVEGKYLLNLAMSYWRSTDDEEACHGYLVSALAAEIAKRNSEKPVTGRDSGLAELEATELHTPAESVTGPISDGAGSVPRLPAVNPWP